MAATNKQLDDELKQRFSSFVALSIFFREEFRVELTDFTAEVKGMVAVRTDALQQIDSRGWRDRLEQALRRFGFDPDNALAPEKLDRLPQWTEFSNSYRVIRDAALGRAKMYLFPCVTADAPKNFVKRVKGYVERQPESKSGIRYPTLITFSELDEEQLKTEYEQQLFEKLDVGSKAELPGSLNCFGCVLIEMCVPVGLFGEELTANFLRWLETYWSDVQCSGRVLLFVHLECAEPPTDQWISSLRARVPNAMCVFKRAEEIAKRHLEAWLGQSPDILQPDEEAAAIMKFGKGTRMVQILQAIDQWQRQRRTGAA